MDTKAIETHVRGILEAIGEDPSREGLIDTPARVARMCEEIFAGIAYTNREIAQLFSKTFENPAPGFDGQPVVVRGIRVHSYCEHHLALMYDMTVDAAYIPHERVLGLSKIARICDLAAKRLQLQERLGHDIADILSIAAQSPDVAVHITASHSCMTARGIHSVDARTETCTLLGAFRENPALTPDWGKER